MELPTGLRVRMVARQEAARVVMAMSLGVVPGYCSVAQAPEQSDAVATDRNWFYPVPRPPAVERDWIDLRIAAVDPGMSRQWADDYSRELFDPANVGALAVAIISSGERPAGYEGPLTLDGVIQGARCEAEELVKATGGLIDEISEQLAASGFMGGNDLMTLFREHTRSAEA